MMTGIIGSGDNGEFTLRSSDLEWGLCVGLEIVEWSFTLCTVGAEEVVCVFTGMELLVCGLNII